MMLFLRSHAGWPLAHGAQVGPDDEGSDAALDTKRREDLDHVRYDARLVLLLGGREGAADGPVPSLVPSSS